MHSLDQGGGGSLTPLKWHKHKKKDRPQTYAMVTVQRGGGCHKDQMSMTVGTSGCTHVFAF